MDTHPLDDLGESCEDPALPLTTPRSSFRPTKIVHRLGSTSSDPDVFGSDETDYDTATSPSPSYKTPNNRVSNHGYYPLSDTVKRHVVAASLLRGRCVIEWCMPESGVDYFHVIALATTADVLDKLEYSWGMQRFTLNLDTRYNIFIMSQKCHHLFDNDHFVLIPSPSVIQEFKKHERGQRLPNFVNGEHTYTFLPRKSMQKVAFLRLNNIPNDDRAITAADHTFLCYPFSNLTITSHVRPEFVIYNAAKKIYRHTLELREQYPIYRTTFFEVLGIYNSWMQDVSEEFHEEQTSLTNTSTSSHTKPRRRKNFLE